MVGKNKSPKTDQESQWELPQKFFMLVTHAI